MAGDGGYGGNGSVYWTIHHRSAAGPEQLKNKRNLGSPDPEHWIDLGVPGKVPARMGTEINGHDPTRAVDIGDGTGNFKVTLLFSTKAKPSADLQTALLKLINDAGVQLPSALMQKSAQHWLDRHQEIGRASCRERVCYAV